MAAAAERPIQVGPAWLRLQGRLHFIGQDGGVMKLRIEN
jgi:hypothetical protein